MNLKFKRKLLDLGMVRTTCAITLTLLTGCASAQVGESFGVSIAGRYSVPELTFGHLLSDDRKVLVEGVNAGITYLVQNGVQVPGEVVFSWRAEGESELKLQSIPLRSQIPADVLKKITGKNLGHHFILTFFVRDQVPQFRWLLTKTLPGQRGKFEEIERGGDWSRP